MSSGERKRMAKPARVIPVGVARGVLRSRAPAPTAGWQLQKTMSGELAEIPHAEGEAPYLNAHGLADRVPGSTGSRGTSCEPAPDRWVSLKYSRLTDSERVPGGKGEKYPEGE